MRWGRDKVGLGISGAAYSYTYTYIYINIPCWLLPISYSLIVANQEPIHSISTITDSIDDNMDDIDIANIINNMVMKSSNHAIDNISKIHSA